MARRRKSERINARIDSALKKRLQEKCDEEGLSISQVIDRAFRSFVETPSPAAFSSELGSMDVTHILDSPTHEVWVVVNKKTPA
jgi:hypothetical protein